MVRKISVIEEDWDHLVVLDSCRYDFFSRLYPAYFEGELERVLSAGSNTVEWRDNSFPRRYWDVVCVSAYPLYQLQDRGDVLRRQGSLP